MEVKKGNHALVISSLSPRVTHAIITSHVGSLGSGPSRSLSCPAGLEADAH